MYYKVVHEEDGQLTSSDVLGEALTVYIPGIAVRPPFGPSFCMDNLQNAMEYCSGFPPLQLWECEGELSSIQPTRMLGYLHTSSPCILNSFWKFVKRHQHAEYQCFGLERLWAGTVFLDTVKLTQRLFTSDKNRGIDDYNDCE